MPKSIIINKHGGPEVLEFVDTKVTSPGPDEIRIKNVTIFIAILRVEICEIDLFVDLGKTHHFNGLEIAKILLDLC